MRTLFFLFLTLLLSTPQLGTDPHETIRLESTVQLSDSPEGTRLAILAPGLEARVLEKRDDWVRVSIEGWIPVDETSLSDLEESTPPVPLPQTGQQNAGLLSGSIFVTNEKGKTVVGGGTMVRMVEGSGIPEAVAEIRDGCVAGHERMLAEAEQLKKDAGYALSRTEDTSAAFDKYDEANMKRKQVLRQLRTHDEECDARVESLLTDYEAARGLSDSGGRFTLKRVAPGDYTIWAWFDTRKMRYLWEVPVTLQEGEDLVVDLTDLNLTRTVPIPKYK